MCLCVQCTEIFSNPRIKDKIYIPRDENFSEMKLSSFNSAKRHAFIPAIENILLKEDERRFSSFAEIDQLFDENDNLSTECKETPSKILPDLGSFLRFRTPELLNSTILTLSNNLKYMKVCILKCILPRELTL